MSSWWSSSRWPCQRVKRHQARVRNGGPSKCTFCQPTRYTGCQHWRFLNWALVSLFCENSTFEWINAIKQTPSTREPQKLLWEPNEFFGRGLRISIYICAPALEARYWDELSNLQVICFFALFGSLTDWWQIQHDIACHKCQPLQHLSVRLHQCKCNTSQ